MTKTLTKDQRIAFAEIAHGLQDLETRAHEAGLHATGHAINCAKNAAGWEAAGDVASAALAAKGERPGEKR